jgi:hypothetical protein
MSKEMKKTWKSISIAFLLSCIIYAVSSHFLLGIRYEGLLPIESALRSFLIYGIFFCSYLALPVVIALLIAKAPKNNRSKSLIPFLENALIAGWVIAILVLWISWYGNQRVQEHYDSTPTINKKVVLTDKSPKVKVIVNVQPSDGLTQANMNQDFLVNLVTYSLK